jgi:hypothetical protein
MPHTILNKIISNPDELKEFANTLERASFYMMISFKDIAAHESIGKILSCYEDMQLLRDGLLEEYHKKVEV